MWRFKLDAGLSQLNIRNIIGASFLLVRAFHLSNVRIAQSIDRSQVFTIPSRETEVGSDSFMRIYGGSRCFAGGEQVGVWARE